MNNIVIYLFIMALIFVTIIQTYCHVHLKDEYKTLSDDFCEKCDDLATARAEMSEDFLKKIKLRTELFEAWRLFHLCNKQRRVFRRIIVDAAEYEAEKGNITIIKNKKDKRFAVLTNEHLQYLLDTERRCHYLDAKEKLNEIPETRDSFERANFEKYLDEFKANKKRLQKIVDDYEKHESEAKYEKR